MPRLTPSLTVAALLVATASAAAGERQRLTLLHTSDLHGAVLATDDVTGNRAAGSLAQVATLVAAVRAKVSHPVLVLDSGDAIQGSPLELFGHVRWGEPSPTIAAMNRVGYAAMAVGNHELNFGLEVLRRAERQAAFPFLSASILDHTSGEPAFRPFLVVKAGEVRVGVLGLTTPAIPGWELPEHYRGLTFEAPDQVARRWLAELEPLCDLVVVLAHTGFERDPSSGGEDPAANPAEDFAWRLAHLPGVDLLLTGHAHRSIPPRRLGEAIVSQPGARARLVTRIDLELERSGPGWRIASFAGENLPTGDLDPDRVLSASLEPLHARVAATLDAPVGAVTAPIAVTGCRLADCAALDLVHAVQLEVSGAELSLAAVISDRTPELAAGPVSWRWVHGFYVYPNSLVAVRLTGDQVKDVLEHAARYYDGLDCGAGGCVLVGDPAIPHYDVDSLAGLAYRVDPTRAEGERIRDLERDGEPVRGDAVFTMVINSYRAAGGGGFPHLARAPVVWRTSEEMTELIGDYLRRHAPLTPTADNNWRVAPDLAGER